MEEPQESQIIRLIDPGAWVMKRAKPEKIDEMMRISILILAMI
jgi:hypothetical protein